MLKLTFPQVNCLSNNTQSDNSKVYFIPKSDGLGIIGIGEIATSLQLTDEFFDESGKPSALSHIASALEQAFNYSHGDVYKSKSTIFRRKPYNRTKALDYLRNLIIREKRNRDKKEDRKR